MREPKSANERMIHATFMSTITKHQEKILELMCNNFPTIYVAARCIRSDGRIADEIEQDYEDSMDLINMGLAVDMSDFYKKEVSKFKKDEGRTVTVLSPVRSVHMLFRPSFYGITGVSRMVN